MKLAFIINSLVSSKKKVEDAFASFESKSLQLFYFPTEYAGHSIELSKYCKENNFDWIISVGGDGTLNEIINGIVDEKVEGDILPSLAMYPAGTGNDYSLSMNTTKDPVKLIQAILKGNTQRIDIGKIDSPSEGSRYFINVADAGMGGEITREISTSGNTIGKWVYYKTILKSLFTFKRPTLKITSEDNVMTKKIISVVIGKGMSFGGGYRVTYDAKLNDGTFFIVVIGDVSVLTYLMKIPKLMQGKQIKHPLVHYFHSKSISLENVSDTPCYLEMDGEPGYSCPVSVTCLPSMINFLSLK